MAGIKNLDKKDRILITVIVISFLALLVVLFRHPTRGWLNILLNNVYFISIALAGMVFLAMHNLGASGWVSGIKRIPEAMSTYLPFGFIIMLLFFLLGKDVYHWAHTDAVVNDAVLSAKHAYLNSGFYILRLFIFFGLWIFLIHSMRKHSYAQDKDGDINHTHSIMKLSGMFLVVYCITFTFASIDWLMSLEPHWYSTIYAWYVISSSFVGGLSLIAVFLILLDKEGKITGITDGHYHDLGKYIFAFSVFWGYLWYSQYLLIWYSNIPEETVYYVKRVSFPWSIIFWANLGVNLILPFFVLLKRESKINRSVLLVMSAILFIGHWLDIYLSVMPSHYKRPVIGAGEIFGFLLFTSLYLLIFRKSFHSKQSVAVNDPYLTESIHHRVT